MKINKKLDVILTLIFWTAVVSLFFLPQIFSSIPAWVLGLIVAIFTILWLSLSSWFAFSGITKYFKKIYRYRGINGVLAEIISWLPFLYFIGCLVLIYYGFYNSVNLFNFGLIGIVIGFLYMFIRTFIEQKNIDKKE